MNITVEPGPWGTACIEDITVLLKDVADHFLRHFIHPPKGCIRVRCDPNDYPRTCYRNSPDEDYPIKLPVQNTRWDSFALQFAHEFCHVLSGYERLRQPGNQWFYETICDVGSLCALKEMAISWQSSPPYPTWLSYAPFLDRLAQELLTDSKRNLPNGVALPEWFEGNEAALRSEPCSRDLNGVAAGQLVSIFRRSPEYWQAIPFLPDTASPFHRFLLEWYSACPVQHRKCVYEVAAAFGKAINIMVS